MPAEEAYRAAVADMAAVLGGSNVEAARAALRSLTGDIPSLRARREAVRSAERRRDTLVRSL